MSAAPEAAGPGKNEHAALVGQKKLSLKLSLDPGRPSHELAKHGENREVSKGARKVGNAKNPVQNEGKITRFPEQKGQNKMERVIGIEPTTFSLGS